MLVVPRRSAFPCRSTPLLPTPMSGCRRSCVITSGISCQITEIASVPRIGETSYGRIMKLKDKLQMLMARHSLNGQKLAKLSPGERLRNLPDPSGQVPAGTGQRLPARQGRERLARLPRRRFAGDGRQPVGGHAVARRTQGPQPHAENRLRRGHGHPREHPVPRLRGGHEPADRRQADHRGRQGAHRRASGRARPDGPPSRAGPRNSATG